MLRVSSRTFSRLANDFFRVGSQSCAIAPASCRFQSSISKSTEGTTTTAPSKYRPTESLRARLSRKLGWSENSKSFLQVCGHRIYLKISEEVRYADFFKVCNMEDTYYSWFIVMELHVWLMAARLMEDGKEGKICRNAMIDSMWKDNEVRSKKLEGALASARREQVQILNQTFQAAIISYDEGLLGDDRALAGAIWRRFFRNTEPTSQEELLQQVAAIEMLVLYVRHQFNVVSNMSRENVVFKRSFNFAPFNEKLFLLMDK